MPRIRYLTLITAAIAFAVASFVMPQGAQAGGGCHLRGMSDVASTTVAMRGNCFVSTVTRVDEGTTVTWVNEDDVAHNVTGAGYTWGGGNEVFRNGTIEQSFDENGIYVYACLLHPGMVGAIVVGDGSGKGDEMATLVKQGAAAGISDPSMPLDEASAASSTANGDGDGGASTMSIAVAVVGALVVLAAVGIGGYSFARASASNAAAAR